MMYINFNLEYYTIANTTYAQTDAVRDKPPHTVKTYPCRVKSVGFMKNLSMSCKSCRNRKHQDLVCPLCT